MYYPHWGRWVTGEGGRLVVGLHHFAGKTQPPPSSSARLSPSSTSDFGRILDMCWVYSIFGLCLKLCEIIEDVWFENILDFSFWLGFIQCLDVVWFMMKIRKIYVRYLSYILHIFDVWLFEKIWSVRNLEIGDAVARVNRVLPPLPFSTTRSQLITMMRVIKIARMVKMRTRMIRLRMMGMMGMIRMMVVSWGHCRMDKWIFFAIWAYLNHKSEKSLKEMETKRKKDHILVLVSADWCKLKW